MKYLLDTCVLLWALEGNLRKLGKFADIINDDKNIVYVSIASYWEILIKKSIGKIEVEDDLKAAINDSGFLWLDIKLYHCLLYTSPSPRDRQKSRMPSSA